MNFETLLMVAVGFLLLRKKGGAEKIAFEPPKPCTKLCDGMPELNDDTLDELYLRVIDPLVEAWEAGEKPPDRVYDEETDTSYWYADHITWMQEHGLPPFPYPKWIVHAVIWLIWKVPDDPTECCVFGEPWLSEIDEVITEAEFVMEDARNAGVEGW